MKGFVTDIGFTVAVLVTAVIVILAMLVLFIIFEFQGKDPMSYSLGFVDLSNKPYLISGGLLRLKIDDRQFIEHAIEASVVGSLGRTGSGNALEVLQSFLDKYELAYYLVLKDYNGVEIINLVDTDDMKHCGPDKKGVCVMGVLDYCSEMNEICGSGRIPIPSGDDCAQGEVCCISVSDDEYIAWLEERRRMHDYNGAIYDLYHCGDNQEGVCRVGCDSTMYEFGNNDQCNKPEINSRCTNVCCIPKKPAATIKTGSATSAEIPLFYRDRFSSLLVTVNE